MSSRCPVSFSLPATLRLLFTTLAIHSQLTHTGWESVDQWSRIPTGTAVKQIVSIAALFDAFHVFECVLCISGLELAYIYAPRSMQGIIMALYWFSQGIGSLLGSATIQWFEGIWFPAFNYGNINCRTYAQAQRYCHLDFYFWFIGGLQVVGIVIFALVTFGFGIGRPVPLRVQRQGHTLVRPTAPPDRPANSNSPIRVPRVHPRAINNSQSPE